MCANLTLAICCSWLVGVVHTAQLILISIEKGNVFRLMFAYQERHRLVDDEVARKHGCHPESVRRLGEFTAVSVPGSALNMCF